MVLQSCLRRLTLSFLESGTQMYLEREKLVRIDGRTCQHEPLNSNALDFALNMDANVTEHVRQLFVNFEQMGISRDRLLKEEHALPHLRDSWPPGKTKACPSECISVQVLMASLISPHVLDAFNEPPKIDAETLDEAYDTNNYTHQQCCEAFDVICHEIMDVEQNGGVRCIDENRKAVSASEYDSLVSYVPSRPPRNGRQWQLIDTYLKTSVLALDGQKDASFASFCFTDHLATPCTGLQSTRCGPKRVGRGAAPDHRQP